VFDRLSGALELAELVDGSAAAVERERPTGETWWFPTGRPFVRAAARV
jgi:hypothetical protein